MANPRKTNSNGSRVTRAQEAVKRRMVVGRLNLSLQLGVIWESPKIKSLTVSIVSPSICLEMIGVDAMIFDF